MPRHTYWYRPSVESANVRSDATRQHRGPGRPPLAGTLRAIPTNHPLLRPAQQRYERVTRREAEQSGLLPSNCDDRAGWFEMQTYAADEDFASRVVWGMEG